MVYDGENVYTYLHFKDTLDGMGDVLVINLQCHVCACAGQTKQYTM